MQKARAFFQIIPVGLKQIKLLAVGGQGAFSTVDTTEWWEEEENSWEEGPTLSLGRSNFAALMALPRFVCSETNPSDHSCPNSMSNQTCLFPNEGSGDSRIIFPMCLCNCNSPQITTRQKSCPKMRQLKLIFYQF